MTGSDVVFDMVRDRGGVTTRLLSTRLFTGTRGVCCSQFRSMGMLQTGPSLNDKAVSVEEKPSMARVNARTSDIGRYISGGIGIFLAVIRRFRRHIRSSLQGVYRFRPRARIVGTTTCHCSRSCDCDSVQWRFEPVVKAVCICGSQKVAESENQLAYSFGK